MINTLKTLILLACFPLLLMVTFWGVLATLVLIVVAVLAMSGAHVTLAWPPAATDYVPQVLWNLFNLTPPFEVRTLHILPASPDVLWHQYAPLLTETTIAAAPYLLGIALLWLAVAFRYENKLMELLTEARGIARSECPPLYETMEELCEQNSLSVPRLYLARELPPNAFASGLGRRSYSVTVTAGLIGLLDREETRAVLAHELSHIKQGDVRLLVVGGVIVGIFGWMAGTLWLYVTHSVMGYPTRYNKLLFSLPFVMLLATTLTLGAALGELLKRILLREREMQADAGAVALTANPSAMASALRQISASPTQWQVPRALRDMLIYAPRRSWWYRLWSTHPAMEKRLAALKALGAGAYARERPLIRLVIKEQ